MVKNLPDRWIRKALKTLLNNIEIDGNTIKCFDSRVPNNNYNHFILLSTQTATVDKANKCEYRYESSILIDVVTSYFGAGNQGNRDLADDIMDKVRELTNDLVLPIESGLTVIRQTQNFENDIVTTTPIENVFRKLMRLELIIN